MNFFLRMPFVRICIFLITGIIIGFFVKSASLFWVGLLMSCPLLILMFVVRQSSAFRFCWLPGVAFFLFFFSLGAILTIRQNGMIWKPVNHANKGAFVAEIIDVPLEKNSTVKCVVKTDVVDRKEAVKFVLYIAKDSISLSLEEGDVILFSDALFRTEQKSLSYGEFDYESYLHRKGISTSVYVPKDKWKYIKKNDAFSIYKTSHKIQQKLLSVYQKSKIEGEEFGVLSALTLGNKSYLDSALQDSYSATGASHILAVSGLHVGIVYLVLITLLKFIFRGYKLKGFCVAISFVSLWIYAFITGLSPSVVRASIMLSFICLGKLISRKPQIFNTVFASAFCMLLYNPFYLLDVGFQLSYLAVLSILLFQDKIYKTVKCHNYVFDKTWSLISVSLAAQLGTMPIVLYHFHQFSNYFWLSGLVVVPLSGVIIYLSMILFLVNGITFLSEFVSLLLNKMLSFMNEAICLIEKLPGAFIQNVNFSGVDVFFVYMLLLFVFLYTYKKSMYQIYSTLILLILYSSFHSICKLFFVT